VVVLSPEYFFEPPPRRFATPLLARRGNTAHVCKFIHTFYDRAYKD